MKIIHCADIHLGSRMLSLPQKSRAAREREIIQTFIKVVEYANGNSIKNILLAGDIFDRDVPLEDEKQIFYKIIEDNAGIDFYYLRGNHDGGASYTLDLPNLHTFEREWKSYSLGENVFLYGLEIDEKNVNTMYSALQAKRENINIVMLHGNVASGDGGINLKNFRDKNIDYLALGHYHSFRTDRIDERGIYAYSGCLEGRGFDELDEKGFAVYDSQKASVEFVPFCKRVIKRYQIDVGGAQNYYDVEKTIKSVAPPDKQKMARVELVGEVEFVDEELESKIENDLGDDYFAISIKDETKKRKDYSALAQKNTLTGEFVRLVQNGAMDEDTKMRILEKGVNALSGEKV